MPTAAPPAPSGPGSGAHHKKARKESFMAFATDKILALSAETEPHEEAPSPQSVRDRTGTWDRLSHATHRWAFVKLRTKSLSQHLDPPRQPGRTESALPREVGRFETIC